MAFTGLTVQNNDLNIIVSKKVLPNFYAGLSTVSGDMWGNKPGFVNSEFEGEAKVNTASVGITRVNRPTVVERELGGTTNGGFISTSDSILLTNTGNRLDLTYVIDPNFDIPALQQGVLTYDIIKQVVDNMGTQMGGILAERADATTFTEVFEAIQTYTAGDGDNIITTANNAAADVTFSDIKAKFIEVKRAQSNLSLNTTNTSDRRVPLAGRVFVAKDEVIDSILVEGIIVTGSEKSYSTIIEGVETETAGSFDRVEVQNNNFRGKYLGYSLFSIHQDLVPDSDLTAGEIYGIFSHAAATTRAISQDLTAQVPAQDYIGIRLQYLRRWGVKCLKPWFAYALVSADYAA